jgi:GMP synthase (glutamine-hydrolysing)
VRTSSAKTELIVIRAGDPAAPVAASHGQFSDFIKSRVGDAWTGEWREHDVRDKPDGTPNEMPQLSRAAGLIVTGSSSSVTEQAPWMKTTGAFLKRAIEEGVPVLGICFGHQLIADAFGGRVEKNPRGREMGTVRLDVKVSALDLKEPLFVGCPDQFPVQATHVDTVVELPTEAVLLATTALEPHAAFALGDRTRCVQFHPEFDAAIMRDYVLARAQIIDAEGLSSARILQSVQPAPFAERLLRSFVERFVRS